jgi:beta-lactam-binding protein with PASTA domain
MVWWKKAIIVFVVFIGFILLFNSVIMPWYVRHDTLVKVPSVIGMNFNDAVNLLDDKGLEGLQGDVRYDESKPIGTILDQNPPPDQTVKDGRRIYLVVSGGETLYDVPNLVGRSVRESKFMLAQRNLELQETESKSSAQYPPGIIVAQVEQPGVKVKKGTRISVVVSTGMDAGNLKIPGLIGKNVEEAKKLILLNKFIIGKINFQPSTSVPINAVIDQYPKANTMAKENQRIDLFVNKIVKKEVPEENEINSMEQVDKNKEKIEKEEKPEIQDKEKKEKKEEIKKEEKTKPTDKKEQKKEEKKEEKKKTDRPKEPEKKGDGTKF